MPVYIIACPICRKQYKLTPNDPSTLAKKTFSCPNCRYSTPFSTLIKGLNVPPQPAAHPAGAGNPAHPAVNQRMHSETRVTPNVAMQAKAYLSVIGSNAKFVLNQGQYVLGRKSSDSTATLQLAPDISMSRQHARLVVQSVGGKLMAQIVCLKTSNPIIINGKVYTAGQPYTLKAGDMLQLGMTRIVFSL